MSVEEPFNIYQEQLTSLYRGLALWRPNPVEDVYNQVSIGDVGYISEGAFIRIFNVTLPWNDESNKRLGEPEHYNSLTLIGTRIDRETFGQVDYYSRGVTREENAGNRQASSPDQDEGITYKCRGRGALLSLPHGGRREIVIQRKVFEKYIRDHVVNWFNWSRDKGLPVERTEDLVLVYGCTLATSWATVVFDDYAADAQVSLVSRVLNNGGASFYWSNIRGTVEYRNNQLDPNGQHTRKNHCVFIKCFRAKRILFWTRHLHAAAEPLPDDPDNSQEDEIQVTQVADFSRYRDPLIGVLDYVVEKCVKDDIDRDDAGIAIAHHDDLQLIKDVDILTADAVEQFLSENDMPLVVADGAMVLQHSLLRVGEHTQHEGSDKRASSGASTTVNRRSDAPGFLTRLPALLQMPLFRARPPQASGIGLASDPPFNVYRDQLSALSQGLALWNPSPPKRIYNNVSIGDVGYLQEGTFIRMFNVTLPCDHPSNKALGNPEPYELLDCGPFANTVGGTFGRVEHYSRFVSAETNDSKTQARTPDEAEGVTYKFRNRGAVLSLPMGGYRCDVIRTGAFENYIRDHIVSWFNWAQKNRLGVERMEELIIVSGCTLVASWAAAVFVGGTTEAEISLTSSTLSHGEARFVWSNNRGHVAYHNNRFDPHNPPTTPDQCVFIRGFRAKRAFFQIRSMRAAAESLPDDPDNRRYDEIQLTQVPSAQKYRDPVIGVLDYIAEKCVEDAIDEDTIVIAHDDDLQLIEDVETLTADAVKRFLREKQVPLLVRNGAAILRDSRDNKHPVAEENMATSYAAAELNGVVGETVPFTMHPVLTKLYTKLEMAESVDRAYDLPKKIPPLYACPPVLSLKLENYQGYPQVIDIEALGNSLGAGVTVQDVLRTIHEVLRMPIPRRELSRLDPEERAGINAAFKEQCKSEEEINNAPRRMDHLGGRDRLQILPRLPPDDSVLLPTSSLPSSLPTPASRSVRSMIELKVAGPSRNPVW